MVLYVDVEENSGEANEKRVVDIFGPGAFYPDVVTGGVSEQHEGGVRLNGDDDENVGMKNASLSMCLKRRSKARSCGFEPRLG